MTTSSMLPIHPFANWRVISITVVMLIGPSAQAASVPPGGNETITNADPIDSWVLNPGSTLNSIGADTLDISANNATLNATGGSTGKISGQINSALNLSAVAVDNSTGAGAAVQISNSTADISGSQVTSNDIGFQISRSNSTQTGSRASLTGGTTVIALNGGAFVTGYSQLNLTDSFVRGTDAASYGVRLTNGELNATGSTIIGGLNGLQIGRELALARASTVTLDQTRVEGQAGSAIIVGYQGRPDITANINVLNDSQLIGANGTVLEVNDGAHVDLTVDRSTLAGNVVVAAGSSTQALFQNGASLNGNLQNVSRVTFDHQSTMTGDVLAQVGSAAAVHLDNGSTLNGNVNNVTNLSLDHGSAMTGNVVSDASGAVLLDNGSILTGQIDNTTNVNINNSAQWVMTGDSTVQRLALNSGVVRMGTNEQFQQLNVGDLSGNGTFVMGTDLGNGQTDFLNVTGNASGQHQLQISATGTTPATAESVKVGDIASGDASFSLGNRETVDAGTFVYRLAKEGQGLYLNPDKETVSTSSNTALALAGSARSVLNAEAAMLSDQLGDRSLSVRPEASVRSMNDSSVKNLSNSVWVRTYGNQYSVDNAYGDGYTQNQTGITGGADTTVDLGGRSWVVGGFVGTSHTKMDLKYGSSATVDSVNAGVYGSTFDVESGVFVNVMAKINQFDNKAKVTMSDGTRAKGDFKALGASGSVAVGKHIRLKDNYFVEPQVQVSTGVIQSDKYRLDNGLEVKSDTMRSLQGKVGVRGGRVIALDNGSLIEPSLMTAVNHEFVKSNEVKINDDSFDDDRASSSIEYGAGLKWTPTQRNWQVSGQVGGSKGTTVSQDWSGSLRVSYFF
ncbi:autotransporter outer membrane beta-barrel domain-containing protein [Pseudomonas lini]|uniref:autotransporter outer membrane beta-barrel domain-containing protein n=1 Tax=Pseudomonas lini TaxID=163011 RepID=UPI00345EB38E